MATFTTNLTGTINCFGPQASTKWGTPMQWGTDQWGQGVLPNFDIGTAFFTLATITDNFTFTDGFPVTYLPEAFSLGTFSCAQGPSQSETLKDASQSWSYYLYGISSNDENVSLPSYVNVGRGSNSWSQQTTSSTTWVHST